jgi:predicted RNA-binding protein with EMAP domain
MGRYRKLVTVTSLFVMVLGLTMVASAQWRNPRGNNDRNGNGRYNANLDSAIKSLRNNARSFENVLDRELDRSRVDGTRREDNLNNLAGNFKNAAEDLDDEFDGYRDMRDSADEARRVVNYGSQLDRGLMNSRLVRNNYQLQNQWNMIERDLRIISQAYRIGYNGQYGRNNGRNNGNNGPYGGNNRNNGRFGNLRSTVVSLRNKSRRFEENIDRYDDNDRRNRRNNGNLESLANNFDQAVKRLEDEYDNNRDYNDSYDEVRRVLSLGEQLDREVSRNGVNRSVRNDWNSIEQDLRTLANAYNLSYNGSSNRNTRLGDIIRNFPF